MQGFQYKHGDRPLEGYTIQRAAGRGGFGEVYYALSDSGREVALKLVQGYEQIELRGITQCMNLKSPHLVTVFDVKRNEQGKCFVIMEFVAGPSLRELIDQSPNGLGTQKAAYFLREIGKGLTYLHDCGIVHRDLKPGNIFYENGYVKIGDYGLSKAITPSQHNGQTITVGTVHYMAPEIGAGVYDAKIDIYAMGALLYEMLTGQPPFLGASVGEILMKHISAEPDLSHIDEPFATVVRKAMAKNPQERYQTVQEMIEAIFGTEHVRNSVSCFSPDSLTLIAGKVAKDIPASGSQNAYERKSDIEDDIWLKFGKRVDEFGRRIDEAGKRLSGISEKVLHDKTEKENATVDSKNDPLPSRQRLAIILATTGLLSICGGVFLGRSNFLEIALAIFLMILGASKMIWLVRWRIWSEIDIKDRALPQMVAVLLSTAIMVLIGTSFQGAFDKDVFRPGMGFAFGIGAGIGIVNWWTLTAVNRAQRVSIKKVLQAGLLAFFACLIFHGPAQLDLIVTAGTCLIVQLGSPFVPSENRESKPKQPKEEPAQWAGWGAGEGQPRNVRVNTSSSQTVGTSMPPVKNVPWGVRLTYMILFLTLLSAGLMSLISLGVVDYGNDQDAFVMAISFGVGSLIFAFFFMIKALTKTFRHWWSSLVKPLLMLSCVQGIIVASVCLGNMNFGNDEKLLAIFFIIFPSILFIVIASIPARIFSSSQPSALKPEVRPSTASMLGVSSYTRIWTLFMAGGIFIGLGGLHRFYVGKIGSGLVWFFTGGFFGIGQLIDAIMILAGQFTDGEGRRIVLWESEKELNVVPQPTAGKAESGIGVSTRTYYVVPSRTNSFMTSLGVLLVVLAFAVSVLMAMHLPQALAAGFPDPSVSHEVERVFADVPNWPIELERLGRGVPVVLLLFASSMFFLARRRAGIWHMVRSVIGSIGLIFSVIFFMDEFFRFNWDMMRGSLNMNKPALLVHTLLQGIRSDSAIIAIIMILASIFIIAWPAKEPVNTLGSVEKEGV
jgi:serine/threonine protein kinase